MLTLNEIYMYDFNYLWKNCLQEMLWVGKLVYYF